MGLCGHGLANSCQFLPVQDAFHLHCIPRSTLPRLEAMVLELGCNSPEAQALIAQGRGVRGHGAHVRDGSGLGRGRSGPSRLRGQVLWLAQLEPPGLPSGEGRLGAGGDQLGFPLGNGRHHVDGQVVRFGHVDRDEADAGLHEGGDDSDVAGEAVKLGDEQDPADAARVVEGGFELGPPSLPGSGFDFGELEHHVEPLAAGVGEDGGLLSLKS